MAPYGKERRNSEEVGALSRKGPRSLTGGRGRGELRSPASSELAGGENQAQVATGMEVPS